MLVSEFFCQVLQLLCYTVMFSTCSTSSKVSYNVTDIFRLFIVILESHGYDSHNVCAASECRTLAYFMNYSSEYFQSNDIYRFQAGTHIPLNDSVLTVMGVNNLTFLGPKLDNESALIECNGAPVGFEFKNSCTITIKHIKFHHCAPTLYHSGGVHSHGVAVLTFINNTNVYLSRLTLSRSVDEAFYIENTKGELQLKEIEVTHSNTAGKEVETASSAIVYNTCDKQMSSLLLEDSFFFNNSNLAQSDISKCPIPKSGIPRGGGLSIHLECDNVCIRIQNITMSTNRGGDGGNLELLFNSLNSFAHVEILNSIFESGYALEGGGIHVAVIPGITHTISDARNGNSCKQQRINFLSVTNTTFISNEAVYAGAGVYIRQKQAMGLCNEWGIVIFNSTFVNNVVCKSGFGGIAFHSINYHVTGYTHNESPQFIITIELCVFYDNYMHIREDSSFKQRSGSGSGSGVIFSKSNQYLELSNSDICDNNSTGVLAISSNIILSGEINIVNNANGSSGGGLLLCQNAVIYFNASTTVTIAHNSVRHTGGGICVETECLQSKPACFFQLGHEVLVDPSLINTVQIKVFSNSAQFAGDNLFGGSIDYCYMIDDPKHKANHSTRIFKSLFNIPNNTIHNSSITSSPLSVCLCDEHEQKCDIPHDRKLKDLNVFPGEKFRISAVVIGQQNGTVPGTVQAWLKNIQPSIFNSFGEDQQVQKIGKKHCHHLHYTIKTTYPNVTLQLGVEPGGDVSGFELLHQYRKLEISVTMKECPAGFVLINGSCDCNYFLSFRGIRCKIKHQIITNISPGWIGLMNKSLVYLQNCPYDYCMKADVEMFVTKNTFAQDEQCAHNRTGIMCGKCTNGLSMVFGTHECKTCSNYWLLLIIVYGICGVLMVILLTVLNLTISEGSFGGLIFYCNIVGSNDSIFFPESDIPFLTSIVKVFVSVINLEIVHGACLFDGMDAYAKTWLHFVFPIYLWLLTGVIILLSKCYSWVARRNTVKVLATIILLSYTQILHTVIEALQVTLLYTEHDGMYEVRWFVDGNLKYFDGKHIPLAVFALLFGLLLLPLAFSLFFIQCLQKVSHYQVFSWVNRLKPLFDAYTGPFNANARFWTGLLLLARIIIFITSAINTGGDPNLLLDVILLVVILLLATSQILSTGLYRRHCLNIIECWFLVNLAILAGSMRSHHHSHQSIFFKVVPNILVATAFLTTLGIVTHHVSKLSALQKGVCLLCFCRRKQVHQIQQVSYSREESNEDQIGDFPQFVQFDQDREPLLANNEE